MEDLNPKKKIWISGSLAAVAVAALALPLSLSTASATPQNGHFGIRATDDGNSGITATVGDLSSRNDGGNSGGGTIPEPEPEPSANSFVFAIDTDLCADPNLYFEGIGADTVIKDPSGDVAPLAEGWNTVAEKGRWTIEGSFAKIGAVRNYGDEQGNCLTAVTHWGETGTTDVANAFRGAANLKAVDAPPSGITTMSYMFYDAISFNADLSDWDTSSVTAMDGLFAGATSFNGSVNDWDTSKVTDATSLFAGARAFNQPLDKWDTSSFTTMQQMFNNASAFDQPIGNWKTSNVTYMGDVFNGATSFNQPLNSWDTSNVVSMQQMFGGARAFDQDLNSWKTGNVQYMNGMFSYGNFHGAISSWDTSKVTTMKSMFMASTFDGDISGWKTANVTNMDQMFYQNSAFTGNLSSWNGCKAQKTVTSPRIPSQFGITDTARQPRWTNCV